MSLALAKAGSMLVIALSVGVLTSLECVAQLMATCWIIDSTIGSAGLPGLPVLVLDYG